MYREKVGQTSNEHGNLRRPPRGGPLAGARNKTYDHSAISHKLALKHADQATFVLKILPPMLRAQRNIVDGRLSVDLWPISNLFENLKLNMGEA